MTEQKEKLPTKTDLAKNFLDSACRSAGFSQEITRDVRPNGAYITLGRPCTDREERALRDSFRQGKLDENKLNFGVNQIIIKGSGSVQKMAEFQAKKSGVEMLNEDSTVIEMPTADQS